MLLDISQLVDYIRLNGGGRGIRTPGALSGTTVFKTAGFNRSPIPPHWKCGLLDEFIVSRADAGFP